MVSNVVEVPICFRNVTSKILQAFRIEVNQVKPCSYVPGCYDMKISRGLGLGSLD